MKLLFDIGVGKIVEEHFMQMDFDVLAIRRINPAMPDKEILALALAENRIIITMDKDFGELIYNTVGSENHPGVILLRMEDAKAEEKIQVLQMIFAEAAAEIPKHFSVYKKGQLRIRK